FAGDGIALNSANASISLNGHPTSEAKKLIVEWIERTGLGMRAVNYKLRDWLFSRQRYWGEPFPLIYLEDGRVTDLPESELPVLLPELPSFQPGKGGEDRKSTRLNSSHRVISYAVFRWKNKTDCPRA